MIPDSPSAASLLRSAKALLEDGVHSSGSDGMNEEISMVYRILDIAARALEDSGGLLTRQAERFVALPGGEEDAAALAAAIRNGRYDDGRDAIALYGLLLSDVEDRLALSNPAYLENARR